MNERKLLKIIPEIFTQSESVIVGPGDDCAVLDIGLDKLRLLAVDQLISDVHYDLEQTDSKLIAGKLLKRNLSDIAAMGGTPAEALLTIACNQKNSARLAEFLKEISAEARKWNVSVCGGDISSIPGNNIVMTLTITGWVSPEKLCLRSNAKAGDFIYCTGSLGNSYKSGHHLNFTPRLKEAAFLAGNYTNTLMDISDGLIMDLARICEMSKVSANLFTDKLPLREGALASNAMSDGEDYELIFALPPERAKQLEANWPFQEVKLSCIGEFIQQKNDLIFDENGNKLAENTNTGFDHFNDK
jgi:thiamine-monophosphate kinase